MKHQNSLSWLDQVETKDHVLAALEAEYHEALSDLRKVAAGRQFSLEEDAAYVAAAKRVYDIRRKIYHREQELQS